MGCNAKQRAECNSGRIGRFGRYLVLFFVKMALVQTCSPSQALTRQIPPFVAARHLPPERGKSFLKGRALGNPRKLHLFAKASPFGRGGFAKQRRRGRGRLQGRYPLSLLTAFAASSPKGTPYGNAGNFAATAEAVPLRDDFPRSGGRCRVATKGGVWLDAKRQDGRGIPQFFPSPAMIHPAQPYAVRERCRNSVRRQKGGKQTECRFWGGKVVRFADFDRTFAKDSPPRY